MGRAPCCDKANVKRGPWSPEEDATLTNYLVNHGTAGNWISLPQRAGLKRCGKSCRLRWLNYLRPDIKHGPFTQEEDNIIISLFYKLGSRWSVIAANLPGRTDNDVKNHWNTKLKKKLFPATTVATTTAAAAAATSVNTNKLNINTNTNTSCSLDVPSPPFPTIHNNLNTDNTNMVIPTTFSALLAHCTTSTYSPLSMFPDFTHHHYSSSSSHNHRFMDHPYYYYYYDDDDDPAALLDKSSSVAEASSSVSGSDDPFLAELGIGDITTTCTDGYQASTTWSN